MKLNKIVCFILVISMAIMPIFAASCGDKPSESGGNDSNNNQNQNQNGGEENTEAPAEEIDPKAQYDPDFEPVDMQGYVFKFGTRDDSTHAYPAHTRDLFAEAINGDLINDAVYKRNMAIEEKYNCKIEMDALLETSDESAANKIVEKSVKAGDKSYDLLLTHLQNGIGTAVQGCFYDIAKFPNIDLSNPYWNRGATNGLSLNHRLYLGLSDLSFSTNENLYCIFFNKSLIQNFNIENPYALVKENKWTFDKFNEIIRVGYSDLNGNGKQDEADQFGYISSSAMNFLWSGGSQIMKKDADDMPYLEYKNQRTIDIFDKAYDITNNEFTFKKIEWFLDGPISMFSNSQGIFYSSQLCRVNDLRATEFDFGIIPYPKFDSAQERYYSYVDGHASMMAIPINLDQPEWTGMIIEDLSYLSYKDILPTYYDVVLNVKMVRDEESVEMLKILFDSKTFDFGYAWGAWDFWYIFIENIDKEKRDFVSAYEKKEAAALKAIQKKIDTVLEFE